MEFIKNIPLRKTQKSNLKLIIIQINKKCLEQYYIRRKEEEL